MCEVVKSDEADPGSQVNQVGSSNRVGRHELSTISGKAEGLVTVPAPKTSPVNIPVLAGWLSLLADPSQGGIKDKSFAVIGIALEAPYAQSPPFTNGPAKPFESYTVEGPSASFDID